MARPEKQPAATVGELLAEMVNDLEDGCPYTPTLNEYEKKITLMVLERLQRVLQTIAGKDAPE